jgi:uncharacterized protein (DUF362 family)
MLSCTYEKQWTTKKKLACYIFDCHFVISVPNLVKHKKLILYVIKKVKNLLCYVITASMAYTDEIIHNKSDFITCRFVVYFAILSVRQLYRSNGRMTGK